MPSPLNQTTCCDVRVEEQLWRSSMLPEGVLDRWLVADGAEVAPGTGLAIVVIEDARHDLVATRRGKLEILVRAGAVVEPGAVIGHVVGAPTAA